MPNQITKNNIEPYSCRHQSHVGSSNTLSPSASTNLSRFGSSDYCMSPGGQLTSPLASGLSSNSTSTSLGLSYVGSPTQPSALRPRHASIANPSQSWAPNPMLTIDWLPQNPSLAAQLGQTRSERMRPCVMPVDALEGFWGFDEFPPIPGKWSALPPGTALFAAWRRLWCIQDLMSCNMLLLYPGTYGMDNIV